MTHVGLDLLLPSWHPKGIPGIPGQLLFKGKYTPSESGSESGKDKKHEQTSKKVFAFASAFVRCK